MKFNKHPKEKVSETLNFSETSLSSKSFDSFKSASKTRGNSKHISAGKAENMGKRGEGRKARGHSVC